MSQQNTIRKIIDSENFDKLHHNDIVQKGFNEAELNAIFEIAGENIHIDEFIESELTSRINGALLPDKVGKQRDPLMYHSIEFETSKPSEKALKKTWKIYVCFRRKARWTNYGHFSNHIKNRKTD